MKTIITTIRADLIINQIQEPNFQQFYDLMTRNTSTSCV